MKLAPVSENLLELVALRMNLVPTPLIDTQMAFTTARAIMAGAELGLFDALASGPKSADDVARDCGTHPAATRQLLDCLVGLGYARFAAGRYENAEVARKWIVKDSPVSLRDKLRFQLLEWSWVSRLEDFVRTGQAIDIHETMSGADWTVYQDGMRSVAVTASKEIAKKLPVPKGATRMLDIGGSHGLYSVELCKRHPALASVILELPEAIARAGENLAAFGMGDRVKHLAGDALRDDLGAGEYDLVVISNLVHHFSAEENASLAKRVARALKPGGVYAICDYVRCSAPGAGGAVGAMSDLYFALTSKAGTWSGEEMTTWLRDAALGSLRTIRFTTMPGFVCVVGSKPAAA
jgi:SAM-dependent methyltransferase